MRPSADYYWMKVLLKEAGLPHIRFPDLHHAFATHTWLAVGCQDPFRYSGAYQRILHAGYLHLHHRRHTERSCHQDRSRSGK